MLASSVAGMPSGGCVCIAIQGAGLTAQSGPRGMHWRNLGERTCKSALDRVTHRMNCHRRSAFNGHAPVSSDIVCSARFRVGTNRVMHIRCQIAI